MISWELFVGDLSGERTSLNDVYVSFLIKLNKVGTSRSSSMLFAKKTVPLVPHKFPISLVSHQIFYPPDSNHIVNIFPTSSSPLSCIRFIRIKSTWYRRAHQCARSQCQPLAQYSTGNYSTPTFQSQSRAFSRFFHSATLAPLTSPTVTLTHVKDIPRV